MKVVVAETAGFCMGVRRAVDMAIDMSRTGDRTVNTLGPLIHNRQTIDMLRSQGIAEFDDSAPTPGAVVLVRAHGVPPGTEERLRKAGHVLVDGTCPKVKTVHRAIEKYRNAGYRIVIAGDEGHAEVVGLMGYAGDTGRLVHCAADVDGLPPMDRLCLVSQTTFDREEFDRIAERVRAVFAGKDVVVKKTICSATDRRQAETRELAGRVDAMIVVGGRNSANTLRLAAIASMSGTPTQHVETEKEVDLTALAACQSVGITAGASTPAWMIKRVVDTVELYAQRMHPTPAGRLWSGLEIIHNLNLFVAVGSVAVYLSSCILQNVPLTWKSLAAGSAISFLYFFSMYLWNSLANVEATKHLGMGRYEFYRTRRKRLLCAAAGGIAAILVVARAVSPALFYLMLFLVACGTLYHAPLVPRPLLRFFRYRSIKDIPTSRDLFVALAWSVLLTFAPYTFLDSFSPGLSTAGVAAWIFVLACLRSLIFDLRDIEGDRIMGRETLVTIAGERRVWAWIQAIVAAGAVVLAFLAAAVPAATPSSRAAWLGQLAVALYLYVFVRTTRRCRIARPAAFSMLADLPFYLSGLFAAAAAIIFG